MVVQRAGNYFCYVCNSARTKGISACHSKYRVNLSELESAIVDALINKLTDHGAIEMLCEKVNEIVRTQFKCRRPDPELLNRKRDAIESQLDNILSAIEKVGYSSALRERLVKKEAELQLIDSDLSISAIAPKEVIDVSRGWVTEKLGLLKELIGERAEKRGALPGFPNLSSL